MLSGSQRLAQASHDLLPLWALGSEVAPRPWRPRPGTAGWPRSVAGAPGLREWASLGQVGTGRAQANWAVNGAGGP